MRIKIQLMKSFTIIAFLSFSLHSERAVWHNGYYTSSEVRSVVAFVCSQTITYRNLYLSIFCKTELVVLPCDVV